MQNLSVITPYHLTIFNIIKNFLFNIVLEYVLSEIQQNQAALKMNKTHELLVYANDVNLLRDNIHAVKKNTNSN
jgi:hypothetical protein